MGRRAVLNILIYKITHFLAGFLTACVSQINAVLSVLMFLIFIIYELDEDWHLSDQAYIDIRDYAAGLYAAATIIYIIIRLRWPI